MTPARILSASLLDQLASGDATLDQLLDRADDRIQRLSRADRALLHAIVFGVLRWQGRLDWVIDQLASRPGRKIDPLVRNILRIGLFQLQHLDRIPESAAVNTSVELAKMLRRKWAAGFVNGVLRQAVAKGKHIAWPDRHKDLPAHLAARHAFPRWLIARWLDRWGEEDTERLCKEINTVPANTLRANTLRVEPRQLMDRIGDECETVTPARHSPAGISVVSLKRPFRSWSSYGKGWFQVQSEASQCVGYLLSPQPGESIWDACAGLGTKAAHAAQLMDNRGLILATDTKREKLTGLEGEMKRLGVDIVQTLQLDLAQPSPHPGLPTFDRILVDAPCTGLGVLQKNPDGKWRVTPKQIWINAKRQRAILEHTAHHLKSGGILVYAVCSFEPEENEGVIQAFLQKHPEFVIDQPEHLHLLRAERLLTTEGFFKTFPHEHQMDGFFAAILKKK